MHGPTAASVLSNTQRIRVLHCKVPTSLSCLNDLFPSPAPFPEVVSDSSCPTPQKAARPPPQPIAFIYHKPPRSLPLAPPVFNPPHLSSVDPSTPYRFRSFYFHPALHSSSASPLDCSLPHDPFTTPLRLSSLSHDITVRHHCTSSPSGTCRLALVNTPSRRNIM